MTALLGYLADAVIIATYALLAHSGRPRAFHWANAIGCLPLAAIEASARVWQPLVLTGFFGAVGWYGILKQGLTRPTKRKLARFALYALGLGHLAPDA